MRIDKIQLIDALSERYLSYAVSTIVSRALPDVRDGLKPVHRRILYSMLKQKLTPADNFRKCATVVGHVLGNYHPHGDSSVYDAMVRLAQNFSVRYPLVNGQGNFGNIDGDSQAAYRYTESKMTLASMLIMEGLNEESVPMIPNFDGTTLEPVVMPGAFPNLLANGGMGIAVGMATNIPTHNVSEICDALNFVIDNKNASTEQILKKLRGPDFPTGAILIDNFDTIVKNYDTGKGSFRIRAKWHKEKNEKGIEIAVIDEIPYGVIKSKLVEQIATFIDSKKLPLVEDIIDESTTDIRIVIIPKTKNIPIDKMMAHLFIISDLEYRFNMNFNVIDSKGVPRVMKIGEVLNEFISHQKNVLLNRTNYRLKNIAKRLEILEGLLIVYLNLDRVIEIIRTEEEPKEILIKEFNLNENQVEAILNTRLRSLRKLEEMEIKKENSELLKEQKELNYLLGDETAINNKIKDNFNYIKKQYDKKTDIGKRRTEIIEMEDIAINTDDFIEKEPLTIILSKMGWIRAAKGHLDLNNLDLKFKEGDDLEFAIHSNTSHKINIIISSGKVFTISANSLPSARGFGESIRMMIDMPTDDSIKDIFVWKPNTKYLLVSKQGNGFIINSDNMLALTKNGKQIMNLDNFSSLSMCKEVLGKYIAISGSNDKLLIFETSEIPELSKGKGVRLQKYNAERTYVLDIKFFNEEGLTWKTGRGTTKLDEWKIWLGTRGNQGRTVPIGFPRSGKFN